MVQPVRFRVFSVVGSFFILFWKGKIRSQGFNRFGLSTSVRLAGLEAPGNGVKAFGVLA